MDRRLTEFRSLAGSFKKSRLGISPAGSRFAHARRRLNLWCTGKDSNLRTSLGGTDLQSVGFNHSPTCAETRSLLQAPAKHGFYSPVCAMRRNAVAGHIENRKTEDARKPPRAQTPHFEMLPYGVLLGKTVKPPRRAPYLRNHALQNLHPMLELAKGF